MVFATHVGLLTSLHEDRKLNTSSCVVRVYLLINLFVNIGVFFYVLKHERAEQALTGSLCLQRHKHYPRHLKNLR